MSRKAFDGGHQNPAHTSGFDLNFQVMHNLFHGGQSGAENAVRGLVDAAQIAETGRTQDDVDDLGDLVDPQNDTYEEEGTHGVPLAIGAAAKAYGKFRKTPAGKAVEAKAIEKGTEIAGKAMVAAKDKLKGKGGAGLASPASEGVGTPDRDDPFA